MTASSPPTASRSTVPPSEERASGEKTAISTLASTCFRLGRDSFPEISWPKEDFEQAFREHHKETAPSKTSEDEFIRLACLYERPEALSLLDRYYLKPLLPTLLRITGNTELADATLQKLREKLLLPPQRRLANYRESGNFQAWLRVVATRTALDEMRIRGARRRRECQLEEHLEGLAANPEQELLKDEWRANFRQALRNAILRLSERERHCLRLHLVAQWSVTQIGSVFSVHRATAARWLVSGKERLIELLREELVGSNANPELELTDFLLDLPTQIDLRLSQLFATTGVFRPKTNGAHKDSTDPTRHFPRPGPVNQAR